MDEDVIHKLVDERVKAHVADLETKLGAQMRRFMQQLDDKLFTRVEHMEDQIRELKSSLETAVAENLLAGPHMSRRATLMFGQIIPPSPTAHIGSGLGPGIPQGTVSLVLPTEEISGRGTRRTSAEARRVRATDHADGGRRKTCVFATEQPLRSNARAIATFRTSVEPL